LRAALTIRYTNWGSAAARRRLRRICEAKNQAREKKSDRENQQY